MEKLIYELRPYFFLATGAMSVVLSHGSSIRSLCGLLLISAAAFVIRQRYLNRVNIRYF